MQVTEITKNGKTVWRVYCGTFDGKKRYKQFKTKTEATTFIRDEKIRKNSRGRLANEIPAAKIIEWSELDQKVSKFGGTLKDAVEVYLGLKKVSSQSTEIVTAAKKYIDETKSIASPYTWSDRKRRVNGFAESVAGQLVCDVEPKVFLNALAERTSNTNADNSRRALSAFFTWAIRENLTDLNPISKIPSFKSSKKNGAAVVLSIPQAQFLLKQLDESFKIEPAGFVLLSLFAGIRPMEFRKRITHEGKRKTVMLTWEDLLDDSIRISSELSKTGTPRLVPINDTLKKWLKWLRKKNGGTLTGPIVNGRFNFTWADWKNEHAPDLPWSAKDILRHSYGTYRVSQAKEVGKIALEMGNSEAIVKKHYWDALRSSKEAEQFWSLAPPKKMTQTT